MHEVEYEDRLAGSVVLAFDGRVLEVFRAGTTDAIRIHARHAWVQASGPDRRGAYTVELHHSPTGRGQVHLKVPGESWDAVARLLGALPQRPA